MTCLRSSSEWGKRQWSRQWSFNLKSDPFSTCSISHCGFPYSIYHLSDHERETIGLCIGKGALWEEKDKGLEDPDTSSSYLSLLSYSNSAKGRFLWRAGGEDMDRII